MAEAVSAQVQVARAMIEVEREPLPVVVEAQPAPDKGNGKVVSKQSAHQLTMTDLWQRHGAQPTRSQRSKSPSVTGQQLSLFSSQQAA